MIPTSTLSILLLSLITSASAVHDSERSIHWGASKLVKALASAQVQSDCVGEGSFLAEHNGEAVCVSETTRVSVPNDKICPNGWSHHSYGSFCIPPAEIAPADCGEGYTWDHPKKECIPSTHASCGPDQWWHERSATCINDSWAADAPTGSTPDKSYCPEGWFWHKDHQNCKPLTKRTYGPDKNCDWDNKKQCCKDHNPPPPPKPSKKPPPPPNKPGCDEHGNPIHPGGGGGGGHGGGGGGGGGHGGGGGGNHGGGGGGGGHHGGGGGGGDKGGGDKGGGNHGGGGGGGGGGGYGGGGGGGGGHGGGHKREYLPTKQQMAFPQSDLDKTYCPADLYACTVFTAGNSEWSWECIDPATELESCGGCASVGEGQDCTKIERALSVGCEMGKCAVYTCHTGFRPVDNFCVSA